MSILLLCWKGGEVCHLGPPGDRDAPRRSQLCQLAVAQFLQQGNSIGWIRLPALGLVVALWRSSLASQILAPLDFEGQEILRLGKDVLTLLQH